MAHSDARDALVPLIAARQYGVISQAQLREAGVDKYGIRSRLRSGRLHRVHPGVYAVGRPGLERHGQWLAAVLSHKLAVLSHRSAAELWALLPQRAGPIHIAVPGASRRAPRRGVTIHRLVSLEEHQVTVWLGIPVTSVDRTIADLDRPRAREEARRARRQADFLGLEYDRTTDDGSASGLEASLLALCARRRLPAPEVNVPVGPYVVDFLWRGAMLVVETDGWSAHRGRSAFEEDRRRDLYLSALGYRVHRFSAKQVAEQADQIARLLRRETRIGT